MQELCRVMLLCDISRLKAKREREAARGVKIPDSHEGARGATRSRCIATIAGVGA
jgi:hypothetical protein